MQPSEIVVSKQEPAPVDDSHNVKIREAYLRERKNLQNVEIELNRSRIVIIDHTGKILKLGLDSEH